MKKFLFFLLPLILFKVSTGFPYDVIDVKDSGTIKGRVKIVGNIPSDKTVSVTKDKHYWSCPQK